MAEALIFDYDGVVVLSEQPRFELIQSHAAMFGVHVSDNLFDQLAGHTTFSFFDAALPNVPLNIRQDITESYKKEFNGNIIKYVTPVEPVVDFISGYSGGKPLALASMSDGKVIEKVTRYLGIYDKFRAIISKDMVSAHKPNPEIYLKAAQALGVEATNCAAIEDTRVGSQAAKNAEMETYAFLTGFNNKNDFDGMDIRYINSANDIERILD
jgi:HAD superfamily hydrolase (TIGR01509 family)